MDFDNLLVFLKELSQNNNKQWFELNRNRYDLIKQEWLTKTTEFIDIITSVDPTIGNLEAKNCLFRINRDVRFSKEKSPYKTNISAYMARGGKRSIFAGYYIHIDPVESFLAAGIWMPQPTELFKIRQEIDYHFEDFRKIVESDNFMKNFQFMESQKLKSVPKGFDKENSAAEYLKLKGFAVVQKITTEQLNSKALNEIVLKSIKTLKPYNDFLNKAIE